MINSKQVFLGCPFTRRNTYFKIAEDAAELYGANIVYGDNSPSAAGIREQAFRLIRSSRLVILDLEASNTNIAVEYGYAAGLGKQVYLLVKQPLLGTVELPSMFKGLQYLGYRNLKKFSERIEELMRRHYRRRPSFIDPASAVDTDWLEREIESIVELFGRRTRSQIADDLNCAATDVTRVGAILSDKGKLVREFNGPDTIFSLAERATVTV